MPTPSLPQSEAPKPWYRQHLYGILLAGVLAMTVLRLVLVYQFPFVMDELYDTNLAVQVSRGFRLYADIPLERMPLMTFLLALFHNPAASSFEAAIAARIFMWATSSVCIIFVWRMGATFLNKYTALLPPIFLISFSNFLERSARVRADSLSSLFSTASLFFLLKPARTRKHTLLSGIFLGLAFCVTQKSIYFLIAAVTVLLAMRLKSESNGKNEFKQLALDLTLLAVGTFIPFLALSIYMTSIHSLAPFLEQTLFYGAHVGLVAETYRDTWQYLFETLQRNPALWFLGLVGAIAQATYSSRNATPDDTRLKGLAVWTLTLFVLILKHNAKFPYVFLNIAPCLSLSAGIAFAGFLDTLSSDVQNAHRNKVFAISSLLVVILAFPLHHWIRAYRSDLLSVQKRTMNRADRLTNPSDAVFDGIGFVTTRPMAAPWSMTARWGEERKSGSDFPIIPFLLKRNTKLLLSNYRLNLLTPEEKKFIETHFVHDWGNIWVAGVPRFKSNPDGSPFHLMSSGQYRIIATNLKDIQVDGSPAKETMTLQAGPHRIQAASIQDIEIRLASSVQVPPPDPMEPIHLFPSYSE